MKTINLNCSVCGVGFSRAMNKYRYQSKVSGNDYKPLCGSRECKRKLHSNKISISCATCNKNFAKIKSQINPNGNDFCSRSCRAKFTNKARINSGKPSVVNCKYCSSEIILNGFSLKQVCNHCFSARKHARRTKEIIYSNCLTCNCTLQAYSRPKKYCDTCRTTFYKDLGKVIGKISATKQARRSKNEIYFYELCSKEFQNVKPNDPFFTSKYGNWDADIILHDHKVAVLWNGIWHYHKVRGGHSPKQTQARDKIKIDVIKRHGYVPYVVKDMGRYNKKFVEQQFQIFKVWLESQMFLGSGI